MAGMAAPLSVDGMEAGMQVCNPCPRRVDLGCRGWGSGARQETSEEQGAEPSFQLGWEDRELLRNGESITAALIGELGLLCGERRNHSLGRNLGFGHVFACVAGCPWAGPCTLWTSVSLSGLCL